MRNKKHYQKMLADNPSASIGTALAASAVYAARYGTFEDEHQLTDEYTKIIRDLRQKYGQSMSAQQTILEMNKS